MLSKLNPPLVETEKRSYAPIKSTSGDASNSNGAQQQQGQQHHHQQQEETSGAAGAVRLIDCGKGSSPYKTSEAVLARLPADVPYEWLVEYPHSTGIVDAILGWWRPLAELERDGVLITAGTMEVLTLVAMLFRKPGGRALGYAPQFPEFENNARFMGIDYRTVALRPEAKMAFSADDLIAAIAEEDSVVYVDNPNNPTGQVIPLADIRRVVEAARARGVFAYVDEAYGDYMDEANSAARLLGEYDNLIVSRTFSKGWGLAGIRAGYILSSPRLVALVAKLTNPFLIPEMGRRLIDYALTADPAFPSRCRAVVRSHKPRVAALCRSHLSVAATADTTPIMLLTHDDPACDLAAMFAALGVEVVSAASFRGLGPNSARLRLPEPGCLDAVLQAVEKIDKGCKNVRNPVEDAAVSF
eukprot:m51a1_g13170 hypothetical protein (414) ;mRNA; f:80078-81319